MTDTTCGGAGCNCEAGPSGYCSEHCASQGEHSPDDTSAQQCGCGHADCEAPATAA
jgi:hypothetical protein